MNREQARYFLDNCVAEIGRASVASSCQAFYRKALALIQDMADCGLVDPCEQGQWAKAALNARVAWEATHVPTGAMYRFAAKRPNRALSLHA